MTAESIMKRDVAACTSKDDVAIAGRLMRDRNCGFLPVIDAHGGVAGIVTDRDLCVATTQEPHRTASHIAVKSVMSQPVFSCFADENLTTVLATMAKHRVRRLPVLDKDGHLNGVISIDDVVRASDREGAPTAIQIVDALKTICMPRLLETVGA